MGYTIAWERRRALALLAVLIPILVPASLILLGLRLLSGLDNVIVINGELVAPVPQGFGGVIYALATGVAWLLAVSAGVAAIGLPSLSTREKVLKAARALPSLALWGFAGAIATVAAFALGPFGFVLLALLLPVLFGRLSLAVPAMVLDGGGSWWELSQGKSLRVAVRVAIGVAGVPLLLAWCFSKAIASLPEYLPSVVTAVVVQLLGMLLLIVVVAGQAGTLTIVYLELRGEEIPSPGSGSRRWIAALALPALVPAVLTPMNGPLITVRHNALQSPGEEIVWNPERPPVIFTSAGTYFCSDNACTGGTQHPGMGYDDETAVGVTFDGVPLTASRQRLSGDHLILRRCAPECAGFGRVSLPEPVGTDAVPRFGIAGAPDGTVWLAVAQQRTAASKVELSLLNCGKARCDDDPKRIIAGTVDGMPRIVHMRFDPEGRLVALFDNGYGDSYSVRCDTVACSNASIAAGPDRRFIPQAPVAYDGGATITNELGYFAVSTEQTTDPYFLRITIGGPPPRFERIVLWHCPDPACHRVRRIPLHTHEVPPGSPQRPHLRIAVSPNGTVLIIEGTTIVSLRL